MYTKEEMVMENQVSVVKQSNPISTNINLNVNMSECEYVKTKSKVVMVSADLRNGAQLQYAVNEQIMTKNRKQDYE